MENTGEIKNSIYIQEDTAHEKKGWIADIDKAHDLANLESPARNVELRMEREANTGMTDEQRENRKIMTELKENYPNAFEQKVASDGSAILVTHGGNTYLNENVDLYSPFLNHTVIFGDFGVVYFDNSGSLFKNAGEIVSQLIDPDKLFRAIVKNGTLDMDLFKKNSYGDYCLKGYTIEDISDMSKRGDLINIERLINRRIDIVLMDYEGNKEGITKLLIEQNKIHIPKSV